MNEHALQLWDPKVFLLGEGFPEKKKEQIAEDAAAIIKMVMEFIPKRPPF